MAPVQLYVYDLTQGMARQLGPVLLGRPLDGIWCAPRWKPRRARELARR